MAKIIATKMGVQNQKGFKLPILIKGMIIAYLITIPLFVLFSFVLTYTDFAEKYIPTIVTITTIISILLAASSVTKNIKSNGWLNGGMVGFLYVVSLYFLSGIVFNNFALDKQIILPSIMGILTGILGGIIGINIKKNNSNGKLCK